MPKKEKNQKVYKFYSEDGELLHCGRTKRPLHKRESEHRRRFDEPDGYADLIEDGLSLEEATEWEKTNRCSPYNKGGCADDECEVADDGDSGVATFVGGLLLAGAVIGIGAALYQAFNEPQDT